MKNIEKIERYLRQEMTLAELEDFTNALIGDAELQKELSEYEEIFEALQLERESAFVYKQIQLAREQEERTTVHIYDALRVYVGKYWQTAAVAASVALIASTFTFFVAKKSFIKNNNQRIIQLVNSDLNKIKKTQAALQSDLEVVKTSVVPDYPSNYTGTGFAISNDGYAITNLHVIAGGKKVFLFTPDGRGHKCDIVHKDSQNDIAVLKVNEDTFSFSKVGLPYKLNTNADLAEKVFTLGYPKDEVVYNEGYVSSLNGKDGDTTKYQLELPSSPGVSGAPVLDQSGNIIGIINSKESMSKGITYAIKSNVVSAVLDSLKGVTIDKGAFNKKGSNMARTNQLKSLTDFIFIVKVYN